ncbi:apses-domain-containing protein [Microthyrium microscopicum]|uniref:Apses-domain-containing protein n=1 Tax=Microthyrium microscopicum TaxID=703497 RepID=A0A6A6U0C6_9PEZI|nr:apses-domain-containing protein [Microthyrium microscopicum]
MATTHAHPPTSGPGLTGHYQTYQPPIMPSHGYGGYSNHGYTPYPAYAGAPVSQPMSNGLVAQPPPLTTMQSAPASTLPGTQNYIGHQMDTSGQVAPPGVKPRVTATLWEDEGTLCFQVEAKGVCVARREDNHMINGTKLLNVAGMTRGRRDGILKSEKMRHVVKIGPMHLKGVWIPFERALDFANKEKITEHLYPLFVHDIGALLYHPQNPTQPRAGAGIGNTQSALAAYEQKRRQDQRMIPGAPQTPGQAAPMHSMVGSVPTPHNQAAPRPGMDRANTFPTPPTSASSVVGVNSHGSPYEYHQMPSQQQLSIDTSLSRGSVPNTPASTPPGKATHGSTPYSATQSYDARPVYSQQPASGQYQTQRVQFGGPLQHPPVYKDEGEHDQDQKHTYPNPAYASQNSYSYNPNNGVGQPAGSPQQNGSGRHTPRTSASQIMYQQPGYPPPQRSNTAPASNVYNIIDSRDSAPEPQAYYSAAPNGAAGQKRGRDDDDQADEGAKRRKNEVEEGGPVGGGSPYNAINPQRPIATPRER